MLGALVCAVLVIPVSGVAAQPDPTLDRGDDVPTTDDWHEALTSIDEVIADGGDQLELLMTATRQTADQLADVSGDESMWVDPNGMMLAFDPLPAVVGASSGPGDDTGSLPITRAAAFVQRLEPVAALAADQTFALHSRPGSPKTIYLDFTGDLIGGTEWNTALAGGAPISVAAWDLDGLPGAYNAVERSVVLEVWRRVAEDFAPFDVDVTTQEPSLASLVRSSANDTIFGTRVLAAPPSLLHNACDCAGVSYVGVFDRVGDHSRFQPGLVFTDRLGASSAKNIAEAMSHEVGHALGLGHVLNEAGIYHDGAGVWAPIMGRGYDRPVTQWLGPDPVAGRHYREIETMVQHGLGLRADDHGDGVASATGLGSGPAIGGSGLISTREDVDFFSFTTTGGPMTIEVQPDQPGANLDVFVDLVSPTGAVIASVSSPTWSTGTAASGMEAVLAIELIAGTYFLRIDGVASGPEPGALSDQGSLGRYTVLGTIATSENRSPIPVARATASSWESGAIVAFDADLSRDLDGRIASVWWDFGDGSVSTQLHPTKSYPTRGNHAVVLTVVDDDGAVASAALLVSIGSDGGVITELDLAGSSASSVVAARAAPMTPPSTAAAALPSPSSDSSGSQELPLLPETL